LKIKKGMTIGWAAIYLAVALKVVGGGLKDTPGCISRPPQPIGQPLKIVFKFYLFIFLID
jgi:hypothetical protein